MTTETLLSEDSVFDTDLDARGLTTRILEKPSRYNRNNVCAIVMTSYEEAEDLMTFICYVFNAIESTVIGYLYCFCSLVVSALAITLGILRYGACPCEPCVPMFLAVGGCAILLQCICQALRYCCRKQKSCDETEPDVLQTLHSIMGILILFWTIPGAVWTFSIVRKVNTSDAHEMDFCDYALYWYTLSFVCVIIVAVLGKLSLTITLCCLHNKYETTTTYSNFNSEEEMANDDFSEERSV